MRAVNGLSRIRIPALAVAIMAGLGAAVASIEHEVGFRPRVYAVKNTAIVVKPGQVIEKGTIVLRGGLVEVVAPDGAVPPDAEVIDGSGLFAYAGFIDALTTSGIDSAAPRSDVGAGRPINFSENALAATHADNRKGLTAEFLASRAITLADPSVATWRKAGFTARLVAPSGGIVTGQSALVAMSGQPRREVLLRTSVALHVAFESPPGGGYPSTLMGIIAHLRQAMLDARHYQNQWRAYEQNVAGATRPPVDATLAELGRALNREEPVWFTANSRDEIHRALDFAEEFNLQPVIYGGREAWRAIDRLKSGNVPVVLRVDFDEQSRSGRGMRGGGRPPGPRTPTPSDPPAPDATGESRSDTRTSGIDSPRAETIKLHDPELPARAQQEEDRKLTEIVRNAMELHRAALRFAFSTEGCENPSKFMENLRRTLAEQLPADAALAALTTQPAEILGAAQRLGTIEPGKLDHVVLRTARFDDPTSQVRYVFLDGEKFEYKVDAAKGAGGSAKAQDSMLLGSWTATIRAAEGETKATLEFEEQSGTVSGAFRSEPGEGKIGEVKQTESGVSFEVEIGAGAKAIRLRFAGKLEGDKLSGTLRSPFGGETEWHAVRGKIPSSPQQSAEKTAEQKSPARSEVATELESDRKPPIQTGGNVLIQNATVLTVSKGTLENASILVRDGRISGVGAGLEAPAGVTTIDATGHYIMPGIIDTHSHMAISGGVNEGTLSIVPEVRIRDVVRSDDISIYRSLAGGVTAARLLHGSANTIGGQDAVIKLRWGKPARQLVLKENPQGVKFALGENVTRSSGRFPNSRMGVEATLTRAFAEAKAYRDAWLQFEEQTAKSGAAAAVRVEPRRDLRLEALSQVLDGRIQVHSHCYRADEILMLLRVADRHGFRVRSLQHVLEGYKVAPEIAAHGASCSTFADWWAYKIEAYDAIPYNAALLREAGASAVIKSDSSDYIRRLNLEAAKTLRYGNVPESDALAMITLNAARELGIDSRVGSIEVGKDADLAIFNGHPLNAFSRVEMTLVDGEIYFVRPASKVLAPASDRPQPHALAKAPDRSAPLAMPSPGAKKYAIRGAAIYPVGTAPIAKGTVVIEGDRIVSAAAGRDVPPETTVIEADGLSVYPGIIDAANTVGLYEIGSLRETQDFAESGTFQPDLLAATALHPESELIPVARAGGVLSVLSRPRGGRISGQSALINLAGWVPREMVVQSPVALHVQWPSQISATAWKRMDDRARSERRDARKKMILELAELFRHAREYQRIRQHPDHRPESTPIDPRLDALLPYLDGSRPVIIRADEASEILEAIDFAQQHQLKLILEGGQEAWKVADRLKQHDVPVIAGESTRLPSEDYDPYDAGYANAARLHAAGVKFCLTTDSPTNARNLPLQAAFAVAFGLPADEALKAVTIYPAEILGIADRLGTITPGKLANLIITDGDPLQPATQIHGVFVAGQPFSATSKHTELYERYRRRLAEVRSGRAMLGVEPSAKSAANTTGSIPLQSPPKIGTLDQ